MWQYIFASSAKRYSLKLFSQESTRSFIKKYYKQKWAQYGALRYPTEYICSIDKRHGILFDTISSKDRFSCMFLREFNSLSERDKCKHGNSQVRSLVIRTEMIVGHSYAEFLSSRELVFTSSRPVKKRSIDVVIS